MTRSFFLTLAAVCITTFAQAQSRVFKQVAEEISSDMDAIQQDGAVVGYVVLTKLEKIKEDSFNYKLTLMDENLNDIGSINMKDINMNLMSVAFEQDVLCLSYYKSNISGSTFKNRRQYKAAKEDAVNTIMNQFVSLDGKIINTHSFAISAKINSAQGGLYGATGKVYAYSGLKNSGQVKNIPGKGFCFLYGDDDKSEMLSYDTKGEVLWKKEIPRYASYSMVPSSEVVYLLGGTDGNNPLELNRLSVADGTKAAVYTLEDKDENRFNILNFEMNQVTGKPYIAGSVVSKSRIVKGNSGRAVTKGYYMGVYTLTLNGMKKGDIKENITYWSEGELKPEISTRGRVVEDNGVPYLRTASQDSAGNTFFAGTLVQRKLRVGSVVASVITAPLIVFPIYILGSTGTHKFRMTDGVVLKQGNKGSLTKVQTLEKQHTRYYHAKVGVSEYDNSNDYFTMYNPATKSEVIIYSDDKSYQIYSVAQNKISRSIPTKVSKSTLRVFGAKEGHIMIMENNKKEKYTKLSIEAI
ncbi:DUF6770 family protein [Ferruginibacter sp. HRS2-29]|uniref:DUF6770 family protein n=1 Tax=Ferruginibacter sp. HRS2-29 TaxID=2487334 RepID=UPI0020CBED2F|nr:DUF6770 family protein [Ferruginibacter sp. HRS2-29]MCP9753219.1 hypothetical protein [Ferruginibacter sp. HRS2-29]